MMMWDGGWGYGGGASWLGMGFMMFFGLLIMIGIVLLIVWFARSVSGGGQGGWTGTGGGHRGGTGEACDIARLRYARGEITKEQFEEICRTVGG